MRLIIASNNAHKVREIKEILGNFFTDIQTLREAGLDIDVVEDGDTFETNALKKATEVLAAAPDADAALSDDSGLMVDALGGAPGVYSARYAGDGHDDAANNAKILADTEAVPDEERGCRFVSAVALARREKGPIVVRGEVEGRLLRGPKGEGGFGYDPLFFYPPYGKSFGEVSADEKNSVSHRKRALMALCEALVREEKEA
ncbi:MAG: RdgB/HAM1 family non-canonical purine NTP pyrophosphatase [Clostridia bacterium]|nr:RdgB/HAM1 family non-canonical purine NTP pyrophosphatase [Candidatus Pelethousia sp.]NCB30804.1 RdgB/HAM1 family non-canonical purine NTP pyrophosphatase [Clostridia bacterium]